MDSKSHKKEYRTYEASQKRMLPRLSGGLIREQSPYTNITAQSPKQLKGHRSPNLLKVRKSLPSESIKAMFQDAETYFQERSQRKRTKQIVPSQRNVVSQ